MPETTLTKKSATLRVFELARELGVTSKDIVAKCEAEAIPNITNHMSTVSPGLAATVREWFGQGPVQSTAVETAAPVDVAMARAKAQKKSARRRGDEPAPAEPVAVVVAPAPPAEPAEPAAVPPALEPEYVPEDAPEYEPIAVAAAAPDDVAEVPPTELEALEAAVEAIAPPPAPAPITTRAVPNVPDRPQVVKPAGPMLQQPTRTKLAGPKIIRVESPEVIAAPVSRSDPGIRRGAPRAGRGVGIVGPEPSESPTEPARPGRTTRRNKRRSPATPEEAGRLGRTFSADEAPFNWRTQDLREREARLSRSVGFFKAHRRDNLKRSTGGGERAVTAAQVGGRVRIEEPITIKNLSAATGVRAPDIMKKLLLAGRPVTLNSVIDAQGAAEVMLEHNIELEIIEQKSGEQQVQEQLQKRQVVDVRPRPPVVTILGHVDHGKTSLLDRIRNTNVAAGEAGGITQATSAFQVPLRAGDRDRVITFIDTPGHEAFTQMRARGADVTDIVVLVVAADDGVMPQTVESINHAKAAAVPIVVALNKIDKPEASEERVRRTLGQLAEHGLNPAEWGGEVEVVRTSATRGDGIQDLLEILDYAAELLELKADFGGQALGTVLEARVEEGRGAVADILVQEGCLSKGDIVVMGRAYGRVRDIVDGRGERLDEAYPSMPVAVSGISEVPDAGDKFYAVKSLKDAEAAASERAGREREKDLTRTRLSLDNIMQRMTGKGSKSLPLVVKADVQGSIDALLGTLAKLTTEEVVVEIKHSAVGGINESDIILADAAGAAVIGFNVTASAGARQEAESRGLDIRLYDIIYDLLEDVRKAAEGLLEPEHRLEILGHAEVRQVFKISRVGAIAGCYVTDGSVERNAQIRVTRDGIVIEKDRRLAQLKRFKDDAKEVRAGQECGMKIDGYDNIRAGDILECYKTTEVKRTI
jgi:translation initiation factor IF-2